MGLREIKLNFGISEGLHGCSCVRTDAQLLYATTEGRILEHEYSPAPKDYARVARRVLKLIWGGK